MPIRERREEGGVPEGEVIEKPEVKGEKELSSSRAWA